LTPARQQEQTRPSRGGPQIQNITCIAAEVTTLLHGGSVEIDVNGVVN
jgi:hypothetical protein